jgi:ELWxxDGT repeat protein
MIEDIRPGSLSSITSATSFTMLNDQILFNAYAESSGMELWISDGTEGGTQLLIDLWPGICDEEPCRGVTNYENAGIVSSGAYAYFFAETPTGVDDAVERQIWRTDGTAEGTVKIGAGTSQPMSDSGNRPGIRIAGNTVFFRGFTEEYGRELHFFTDPLLGEGGGGVDHHCGDLDESVCPTVNESGTNRVVGAPGTEQMARRATYTWLRCVSEGDALMSRRAPRDCRVIRTLRTTGSSMAGRPLRITSSARRSGYLRLGVTIGRTSYYSGTYDLNQ